MVSDNLIRSSKRIALLSLIIGTLIFLLFLVASGIGLGLLGGFFIIIAGLVNLIYLILLLIRFFKVSEQKSIIIRTIGLILLNIPILLVYSWIAINWINTLRITFVNETSVDLTNIKVVGCEDKTIESLKKGQSKTIWLKIPGDCGVSINYKLSGVDKSEDVTGYVTNENGYSMTF